MVRLYTEQDHSEVSKWWSAHNMPAIPKMALPKVGFMVQGVAAGFLYQTDSSVAFIENFISNPESDWATRQTALDDITNSILRYAISHGFKQVVALTTSQAIYERACPMGFTPQGAFQVLTLNTVS